MWKFGKAVFFNLVMVIYLSSCISNKKIAYFNDNAFSHDSVTHLLNTGIVYFLQPGDVINVRIKTLDTESSAYFNLLSEQGENSNNSQSGLYINSYSISRTGEIELPEVGAIKVSGLSIEDCQNIIKERLDDYLNNPSVIVKLVSFKITVLGEVKSPGYYYVYNNRLNLLEGLGLAHDLTDFGDRENVTVIRQTQKGSDAVLVNLNSSALFASEYFNLKPNDVIYVPPVEAKIKRSNANNLALLSVLFGGLSTAILMLNFAESQ